MGGYAGFARTWRSGATTSVLPDVDSQNRIGVLATPIPVGSALFFLELRKFSIFATVLFHPHPIGPVLAIVPLVIFVSYPIMVSRGPISMVIVCTQQRP